ncbi:7118_t:CDS:10 [Acaulospora colombiana]|uniref:7118_t:CDS:1 n=1 Tax=Acaulospora colombiana TaxID=27376 RepID=A0ACA9KSM4_9GLOM|nr:7118_t:CDS:10 [Acaulospora colombiana]
MGAYTSGNGLYEHTLQENEREAVADLLTYLENRAETNFFEGDPLRALSTLAFSDNVDLQRSAALAFAEITEKAENKLLIVQMGGLEPLIRQMLSPNVEVQCNAVGCITNLATHDENKSRIAKSGALVPLTRLARSKDMRVQRNATGALLNMTHSDENRQQLVNAGAIPVLVSLLNSSDTDVQYYCTTALSNIAVDGKTKPISQLSLNRKKLAASETRLVQSLIGLMDSTSLKVQCQAALALRNLASDGKRVMNIDLLLCCVTTRFLHMPSRMHLLLQSSFLPLILSSVACIRNISIHPLNESPIIDAGFLSPLIQLLAYEENEEIQCHAISTLRNLAASSERNKRAIVDAGAVEKVRELVLNVPSSVQSEMTACVAVLALSDELKPRLLKLGICRVLIPLTNSSSMEVQGNSAAALGNLSSKVQDYSPFVSVWDNPAGGLNGYLQRFLSSSDKTFQHIAVWTIVQFLEGKDLQLLENISSSKSIVAAITQLVEHGITTEACDEEESDEEEIVALARKTLTILENCK